jgi:heat shock protein HslJ
MSSCHPRLAALLAVVTFSAACAPSMPSADQPPPARTPTLNGTAWVLSALPGATLVPGTTVTMRFTDGRATGSDGCNRFGAAYRQTGGSLRVLENAVSTQMACDGPVMAQARALMEALTTTTTFRVAGETLSLIGAGKAVVATFTAQSERIAGTSWRVTGYNNGRNGVVSVAPETEVTMSFTDARLSGSAGCNSFTAPYTREGERLTIAPAAATRKMCPSPPGLMAQEQAVLAALATVASAERDGDRLTLRASTGAIVFAMERVAGG